MRVTPDELRVHGPRDLLEVALAPLLEEQGQEVDLEEEIAELVEQLRRFASCSRVGDLVGLLDRVRDDRQRGLLTIPRAVATEPARQLLSSSSASAERPPTLRCRSSRPSWPSRPPAAA